jgi:hypothetical protein
MTAQNHIRPEGRWLIKQLVGQTGESEATVEAALNAMIERGHVRVLHGKGPYGLDAFQPLIRGEDTSDLRIGGDDD